jgi:hypothetical protein
MGAMQARDYGMAKLAVALRMAETSAAAENIFSLLA